MHPARAASPIPAPADLVGTFRRFSEFGPAYEITRVGTARPGGDVLMHVRVPETGEEAEVLYSAVLRDPEAD